MKIQVLGSGCPNCKKLFELTKQVVRELGMKAEVEYINDLGKIIEMGVMQTPILAINGIPVMTGYTSDSEKIKDLIRQGGNGNQAKSAGDSGCSCGGHC